MGTYQRMKHGAATTRTDDLEVSGTLGDTRRTGETDAHCENDCTTNAEFHRVLPDMATEDWSSAGRSHRNCVHSAIGNRPNVIWASDASAGLVQEYLLKRDPQPQSDGATAIHAFLGVGVDQATEVGISFEISNNWLERRHW